MSFPLSSLTCVPLYDTLVKEPIDMNNVNNSRGFCDCECGCMDVWMCGYMDVRHVHMYAFVCKYEYMQTYELIIVLHLYIYNLL